MSVICHIQNWALLISRYKGISTFTDNTIPEFLHAPSKSEEGEFIYKLMVEQAEGLRSVETLLLLCFSEDYLKKLTICLEIPTQNVPWSLSGSP